jgi:hypothetical protein
VLQDRLCFTVTATGAYGSAAELAGKWGCPVDDSTLHALVRRVGQRAGEQRQQRQKAVPPEGAASGAGLGPQENPAKPGGMA